MQSASVSFPLRLVRRTRDELPGGVVWSAGLLFLLTLAIAKSTVTAQWVPGIEVVTMVALVGAVFMGLLAVLPIPWGVGVGIGMVAVVDGGEAKEIARELKAKVIGRIEAGSGVTRLLF